MKSGLGQILIRQLTKRHAAPLPQFTGEVAKLAAHMEANPERMGFQP